MNIAVILSGGSGSRMKSNIPKQYLKVKDKEILYYTLSKFQNNHLIDGILVCVSDDYLEKVKEIKSKYNLTKIKFYSKNGLSRQESVMNSLKVLENFLSKDDIVLIHDGVRPLVEDSVIEENINIAKKYKVAITCNKTTDTIISVKNNQVDYLNRDYLFNVQTPQSFRFEDILNAHSKFTGDSYTDDSQLMVKNGYKIHIVESPKTNIKITTREDLKLFEYYLDNK